MDFVPVNIARLTLGGNLSWLVSVLPACENRRDMTILVTGSAGHLGEALMRTLLQAGHQPIGVDIRKSAFTHETGSIVDRSFARTCMRGVHAVLHTATLHKPHIATHTRQDFVDTNITGTLNLLEEATAAGVAAFIFTSTTSVFGRALTPPPGEPAAWITEDVVPVPKNIYGITKLAAENLCELFHRARGLPCIILRTSRFFPESDDRKETRESYADANVKINEFLYRRADIEDVVDAHLLALEKAHAIRFGRYIVSATTPFTPDDRQELHTNAAAVVKRRVPRYEDVYFRHGWTMFPHIDRVYINERGRNELGWRPRYDFARIIELVEAGKDPRSPLAQTVGSKGYHADTFAEGPYPVE
jgi:nucleoside-diphosphate-sugar epimerase